MPTEQRVQQFLTRVKSGQTIDALREFYTEDALQQENQQPPRRGMAELIAHEERMLAAFERVDFEPASVLIDGDNVAIRYIFSGTAQGREIRQDEVALQRWAGERIAEEYFYYDPGQKRRSKSA